METSRRSTAGMDLDETSCGVYCQHPACWQSNVRKEKGFPFRSEGGPGPGKKYDEENISLPEMTVYNLIEDYGDDDRDRYPAKYSGQPSHDRAWQPLTSLDLTKKSKSKVTLTPLPTPESVVKPAPKKTPPKVKVVEVQELFDLEDLEGKWDETFITKQCYVWVPNPNKKHTTVKDEEMKMITASDKPGIIPPKDVTEDLVPEKIELEREETRLKQQMIRCRSPYNRGRPCLKSSYSHRVPFDSDGLNKLLSLPSDVLMQVLDHLKDSDFMSKDRIDDVIQDFQPLLSRDLTGISIGTAEALKQKKMALLKDKKRNIRESHLMETRPVFQLDDGFVLDQITCVNTPVADFESEKAESPSFSVHGFNSKYKKPLPAIGKLRGRNKINKNKIPSVSLGLPELPTGIKHTKPFTYKKTEQFDLSIGPMPTPPTSTRCSSISVQSEHGTTLNVNVDSPEQNSTSTRKEISVRFPEINQSPDFPEQPRAPMTTPSNNRDSALDKEPSRTSLRPDTSGDRIVSPNLRVNVPENSPSNSESALRTIPEVSARDPPVENSTLKEPSVEAEVQDVELTRKCDDDNTRENDSAQKTYTAQSPHGENSTYSSPDPWPQVTEVECTTPDQKAPIVIPDGEASKDNPSESRSDIRSRESDQELARKIMDGANKGISPAPPPPSPECKEQDRTLSGKPISRESVMEPVPEEESEDYDRGEDVESNLSFDSQTQVVTVSEVVPNPQSLLKEKSFHNFVNVDIPALSNSEPSLSAIAQKSKFERSVQSFVSVDIPAACPSIPETEKVHNVKVEETKIDNSEAEVSKEEADTPEEPPM